MDICLDIEDTRMAEEDSLHGHEGELNRSPPAANAMPVQRDEA
tara:strand:+ start:355 stop:483 length:129 start_codon:yes stop_codon:yes gene_type:complete